MRGTLCPPGRRRL